MRYTTTMLLLALCPVLQSYGQQEAVVLNERQQAELELLSICENFNGESSLPRIAELINSGINIDAQDSAGDTALLLLCRAIEMDYRYRHDAHFAQAVDKAFELILRGGANAMLENHSGCHAIFFLQSKPELLQKLQQQKLLPKELAIRIPYHTLALLRYMRLRAHQATCTTHPECLAYLKRVYCAPAYQRVEQKISGYLTRESAKNIPKGAIHDCLAFLRLADEQKATQFVNNLVYWEHGEHFIEEIPAEVLSSLHRLGWSVSTDKLHAARKRLHVLMPREGEDMISCNSARPLILVLEMIERQEGDAALPLITEYTQSRDPEVAYHAYRMLLRKRRLPAPDPKELEAAFGINPAAPQQASLSETQRRIYECAVVDLAMRKAELGNITAAQMKRVAGYYRDFGLTPYAEAVEMLLQDGAISTDAYVHQNAYRRYAELVSPAPRATCARFILEHPEHFSTTPAAKP